MVRQVRRSRELVPPRRAGLGRPVRTRNAHWGMELTTPLSVEASLFFVTGNRVDGDPEGIRERGIVVYGEALVRDVELPQRVRVSNEGSKVRRLEWQGPLEQFRSLLQQPTWDHYPGKLRFVLGLVRRPALLELPGASLSSAAHDAGNLPPAATGSEVDVYVCSDKDGVADTFVKACGGSDAAVEALDRVSHLTQRELRGRDVAMLGDVYVARRKSELDQPVRGGQGRRRSRPINSERPSTPLPWPFRSRRL